MVTGREIIEKDREPPGWGRRHALLGWRRGSDIARVESQFGRVLGLFRLRAAAMRSYDARSEMHLGGGVPTVFVLILSSNLTVSGERIGVQAAGSIENYQQTGFHIDQRNQDTHVLIEMPINSYLSARGCRRLITREG